MDPLVVVFGLGVGILVGLTGIGGGSLMTPLLLLVVGTPPIVAIGTDLAYGAITKTVGGWRHLRQRTVDLRLSTWLAVGSVPGAVLGVWLVDRLNNAYGDGFQGILLGCIAGALLVVAFTVLGRALFLRKLASREVVSADLTGRRRAAAVLIGAVLGLVLGFTSLGSGALVGFALILFFRLTPGRVVGTDVFHAAILLWAAGLAHLIAGNVDFGLMANILLGSVPGVWVGAALMPHVPVGGLRVGLGCVLLGSALGVLSKAGLDVPVWVILGLPLAVGLLAAVMERLRSPAVAEPTTERAA
ncbi:MAG: sulfite exporter TauE/SafE family protein [Solirubrobacteraceae bacterium MAG38_C4-C5]|nr:sulfite exporter TauE/SafE family protein [Candidatus Siliceabacter maunaloa]